MSTARAGTWRCPVCWSCHCRCSRALAGILEWSLRLSSVVIFSSTLSNGTIAKRLPPLPIHTSQESIAISYRPGKFKSDSESPGTPGAASDKCRPHGQLIGVDAHVRVNGRPSKRFHQHSRCAHVHNAPGNHFAAAILGVIRNRHPAARGKTPRQSGLSCWRQLRYLMMFFCAACRGNTHHEDYRRRAGCAQSGEVPEVHMIG